ncbi:phospholipid-transporting P-type ATPase [Paratrimastix pyriformis]|uniref:Phospholipid-transporting ATPase n=1 Tax=Paratrimastix pyriformis TaxID=342808 RepID=A0ABQ8URX3_9EUKA|nr:phospholipid-transporting P-type ATPase [Paratrimastix pyriformis]
MNIYFLIIGVLQLFPSITPVNPITTWLPIIIIFTLSALKELLDDIMRYRSDKRFNTRLVSICRNGTLIEEYSESIRVGDIVMVKSGEEFPCDLVLLKTGGTTPADNPEGLAFIQVGGLPKKETRHPALLLPPGSRWLVLAGLMSAQTANLDGESDLKQRSPLEATQKLAESQVLLFKGVVEGPLPNPNLLQFDARIFMDAPAHLSTFGAGGVPGAGIGGQLGPGGVSLTLRQLLPQATVLKNTPYILGLAMYTGNQSKIGCNKATPPSKMTRLEGLINRLTFFIFFLQLALVLVTGLVGDFWQLQRGPRHWYLALSSVMVENVGEWFVLPLRFLLLLSLMIPISIKGRSGYISPMVSISSRSSPKPPQVTLDFVKLFTAFLLNWDLAMWDDQLAVGALARSTALAEDLGQVTHVLSDKTGTLTQNLMQFQKCAIGTRAYGSPIGTHPVVSAVEDQALIDVCPAPPALPSSQRHFRSAIWAAFGPHRALAGCLQSAMRGVPETLDFLRSLALCHTVQATRKSVPPQAPALALWNVPPSASPDEEALVKAARQLRVEFVKRDPHFIDISVNGRPERYEMLALLEFTPARRRMSVAVRRLSPPPEADEVLIITKGADDVIMARADPNDELRGPIQGHVDSFARTGLRTLIVSMRRLSGADFAAWNERFLEACASVEGRESRVADVCEAVERNLRLVGVTAIEDKLQVDVAETIDLLRRAGIVFWMLTGDKMSTARQIATSCALMSPTALISMGCPSGAAAGGAVRGQVIDVTGRDVQDIRLSLEQVEQQHPAGRRANYTVVLEGTTLETALAEERLAPVMSALLAEADTVICCRATPRQKEKAVRLVRKMPSPRRLAAEGIKPLVLAIGDGGNDVPMIQNAQVGVGIQGREGLQASLASDYSIPAFRHLRRLTMLHGRYAAVRLAFIGQYCFYKAFLVASVQLLFNLFTGFSGASFFNSLQLAAFNMIYTAAPPVAFLLDRDVEPGRSLTDPDLYRRAVRGDYLNKKTFFAWMLRALYQAAAIFFITAGAYGALRGTWIDQDSMPVTVYTAVLVLQIGTVLGASHTATWINHFFIWGSFALYVVVSLVLTCIPREATYGIFFRMLADPVAWLAIPLSVAAAWLPFWLAEHLLALDPSGSALPPSGPPGSPSKGHHKQRPSPPLGEVADETDSSTPFLDACDQDL